LEKKIDHKIPQIDEIETFRNNFDFKLLLSTALIILHSH